MLSLEKITLSRGGRTILKEVSLTVEWGNLVALLGPNGSGKTTLLHYIAGLLKADAGAVSFKGNLVDLTSYDWRRRLSYVLDDGGTIPLLTAEEQLSLQCLLTGTGRSETAERARHIIDLLGLQKHRNFRADELSAGLRKRLGLGLGVVRDADIFLFDEPFNGLDIEGTIVLGRIFGMLKSRGRIVLVASHAFPFQNELYTDVWSFSNGSAAAVTDEKRLRELLERPFDSRNLDAEEDALPWIHPAE